MGKKVNPWITLTENASKKYAYEIFVKQSSGPLECTTDTFPYAPAVDQTCEVPVLNSFTPEIR